MRSIKIKNEELTQFTNAPLLDLPKYSTQLFNLANSNSQATRPQSVGQLSELIQEFQGENIEEWEKWYLERFPNAIEEASAKVFEMIKAFKGVLDTLNEEHAARWVKDLVIFKTYIGFKFQAAIFEKLSIATGITYRKSSPSEESVGIDGFLGDLPISIKPATYKSMQALNEEIQVEIIYYTKTKSGLTVELSDNLAEKLKVDNRLK